MSDLNIDWFFIKTYFKKSKHKNNFLYYHICQCIKYFLFYCYLSQKLCFWTGIIFISVYVSVCVSVCLSVCVHLPRLSQKVLGRFWWNLAGWFILIKDRFLSQMSSIGPLERKLQKTRIYIFIYYVPLIIIFMLLPLVYHWRGKMQLAS